MKKILFALFGVLLYSCSSDEKEEPTEGIQDVSVTLSYTLANSGSMTRSTYSDFYNKYIETRLLTPSSYSISFKNIENGDSIVINGKWKNKNFFVLREGTYSVKGVSYPSNSVKPGFAEYIVQDTVSLCFDEKIEITKNMSNLSLKAKYDCFMLLFDNDDIDLIYYDQSINPKINSYKINNIFYMFVRNKKLIDDLGKVFNSPLYIKKRDGYVSELWLDKFNMEIGKFYYFKDTNGTYNLSPMDNGY